MRKGLASVPVYVAVGRMSAAAADKVVASGSAHSLRGRSIILFQPAKVAELLQEFDVDLSVVTAVVDINRRARAAKRHVASVAAPSRVSCPEVRR